LRINKKDKHKMKQTFLLTALQDGAKRISMRLGIALAVTFPFLNATAGGVDVNLGAATNFAVLAGSAITVAGAVHTTTINGDIGSSPTPTITGLENVTLNGVNHGGDAVTQNAKGALSAAYTTASGFAGTDLSYLLNGANQLGDLTLTPGVYSFATSVDLTGKLTLNDNNTPDAVFIFQVGTALTTESYTKIVEEQNAISGLEAANPGISVFWQVGSSATLGTYSDFVGNILANQSITVTTGATVDGRLLAENAAVTLDTDTITAPPPEVISETGSRNAPDTGSTLLLLGSGMTALLAFRRRFSVLLG
jgi:hypothetical protein